MPGLEAPFAASSRPAAKPPFVPSPLSSFEPIIDNTPISSLTTLNSRRWEYWLNEEYGWIYPAEAHRILNGIRDGVPIEYEGLRKSRFGTNPKISDDYAKKVSEVIAEDVAELKKAGPFDRQPFEFFCVSPIGAVPKKNSSKIRVIHNLSFPFRGDSVNAGISDGSLQLSTVGHAARAIRKLGRGCWLVKIDIKAAYKIVPVRREDWWLLGFKWEGKWYYERVLPFGLRSSCKLWELFASALRHFIARSLNLSIERIIIHYVDDFLFVVKVESDALIVREAALGLCTELGIPIASDKTEGPTTCLTFLGIELDTVNMQMRLPQSKLLELQQLTTSWLRKRSASVLELQSLVGTLQFACTVVRPGRYYIRRLISLQTRIRSLARSDKAQYPITRAVLADLEWWIKFIPTFTGHSMLYELDWISSVKMELFTDACSTGFGGYYQGDWFAGTWSPEQMQDATRTTRYSMPYLELYALVLAAVSFGPQWTGKKIVFRCDCLPVVMAITRCSTRQAHMMHLLRILSTTAVYFAFDFQCTHIAVPGLKSARITGDYYDDFVTSTTVRAAASSDLAEITAEAKGAVDEYIFNAISANTRRTYQGPQRRYTAWCEANALEPLPITPSAVLQFLANESKDESDKSSRTIAVYRSALSTMHEESKWGGEPNPVDDPRVTRLMKGVVRAKIDSDAAKKEAVTPTEVVTPSFLVAHEAFFGVGADSPDDIMKWAACCLGSFGALRKTELLGSFYYPERRLRIDQIEFHRADAGHTIITVPASHNADCISHLSVKLGVTKADPLARNKPLLIYSAVAVRAMWRWVNLRVTKRRYCVPEQLFWDGTNHLSMSRLSEYVVGMYTAIGKDAPKITGKAFRKGAASDLVSSGIPNSVGADLGRWKTAAMVDTYATPAAKADRYEKMSRQLGQS